MELDGTYQRDKAETGKKGIRPPTTEGLFLEGGCNRHLYKGIGGLPEREIIILFMGN